MSVFTQIVILIIVLTAMVMVLLAIRHLTRSEDFDDTEETINLKDEVENDGHVLSNNSIFSTIVETETNHQKHDKDYRSNSKDPYIRD